MRKIKGFYPNNPVFKCGHCEYEVKNSRKAIDLHLKISHGINRKQQVAKNIEFCEKENDEKFVCVICRKYFSSKNSLGHHAMIYGHYR